MSTDPCSTHGAGELSEQLETLNASLAIKQALLAAQREREGRGSSATEGGEGGVDLAGGEGGVTEDVNSLQQQLASLEVKLAAVETERDALAMRQVRASSRAHTTAL
jgi:hypothetical protein